LHPEAPRGGGGGAQLERQCSDHSAIRQITFILLGEEYIRKYVSHLTFNCYRPRDGSFDHRSEFHFGRFTPPEGQVGGFLTQSCEDNEYAVGVNIRHGTHVNAIGLVCKDIRPPLVTKVQSNGPGDVTFLDPTEKRVGYEGGLDACLRYGQQCGQVAAADFCQRKGYKHLVSFETVADWGSTVIPDDGRPFCVGAHCVRFSNIRCTQHKSTPPTSSGAADPGSPIAPPRPPDESGVTDPGPIAPSPPVSVSDPLTGSTVGNGWHNFTHYFSADFTGDGKADLLVRSPNGDAVLYPFNGTSFIGGGGPIVAGKNWKFTAYWAEDWNGDLKADILARSGNGDVFLFAMGNNTFASPQKVVSGWYFTHFLPADYTGDSMTDMLARTTSGDIMLITLSKPSAPTKVGHGWSFAQYFAGDFTGDKRADLVVRNAIGDMALYPMGRDGFYDGGGPIKAGHGWQGFTHYWVGDWTRDGVADLLVRSKAGDMQLFPIKNNNFYDGHGPIKAANGWHFTHYFSADFSGDGAPDMVVRTQEGNLLYFPWKGEKF
jgi:hypothetical protein